MKRFLSILLAAILVVCIFNIPMFIANADELDDLSTTDGSTPYPLAVSSYCNPGLDQTSALTDGIISYAEGVEGGIHNRWTNYGHSSVYTDWVGVQFGTTQLVSVVDFYVYLDPDIPQITNPAMVVPQTAVVQYRDDNGNFVNVSNSSADPVAPAYKKNTITFDSVLTREIRIVLTRPSSPAGKYVGLTEITAWGKKLSDYKSTEINLALNETGAGFPETSTSHYNASDTGLKAVNGIISYTENSPRDRWALWNHLGTNEWLVSNFGEEAFVNRAEIFVFDDGGNTTPPASMNIEYDLDGVWTPVNVTTQYPAAPRAKSNIITFEEVKTTKIRFNSTSQSGKSVAFTEIEIYGTKVSDKPEEPDPNRKNLALNPSSNTGSYPQPFTSYSGGEDSIDEVVDGIISGLHGNPHDAGPRSRWSNYPDRNMQTIGTKFDEPQLVEEFSLYIFNDGGGCLIPASIALEYYDDADDEWKPVSSAVTTGPVQSNVANHANRTWYWSQKFTQVSTSSIRAKITPASGASFAISEMEVYGYEQVALGYKLNINKQVSSEEPAVISINLTEPAPEGGKTLWLTAKDTKGAEVKTSVVIPEGLTSYETQFDFTSLANGEIKIISSPDENYTETKEYATTKIKVISQEVMDDIFKEVETPYDYGVTLKFTGVPGDYDSDLIDNPNVFRIPGDDEYVYMTYVGHNGIGYQTGLARSKDYLNWERMGVIIDDQNVQNWDKYNAAGYIIRDHEWGKTPYPHVVPEGVNDDYTGMYAMTYLASDAQGYEAGVKKGGIAFAPSILNQDGSPTLWQRYPDPILDATQNLYPYEKGIIWKTQAIYDAENERYAAFYNCASGPEIVAQAYSTDLINWTREENNPTVVAEMNDGFLWGNSHSADPDVVKIGDYWVMFYFTTTPGGIVDSFAVSSDMVNWTKSFKILTPRDNPWSSTYAHKPCVFKQNGIVYHYYNAVGSQGRVIAVRTSEDLSIMRTAQAITRGQCASDEQFDLIQNAIDNLQYELQREDGSLEQVNEAKDILEDVIAKANDADAKIIATELTIDQMEDSAIASVTVANATAETVSKMAIIIASYDENGKIIEVNQEIADIPAGDLKHYKIALSTEGTYKVKAFLWNKLNPMCKAVEKSSTIKN